MHELASTPEEKAIEKATKANAKAQSELTEAMKKYQEAQEAADKATTATAPTADAGTEAEDHNLAETIINPAESPDDKQAQDEAKNGQSPFAQLSRAELHKRIGIN